MRMRIQTAWMLSCALLLVAGAAAASSTMWLHVRVDEGGDGAKVRVNLPLTMVQKAWTMIPRDGHDHADWHPLHEADLSVEEMRELWSEVRNSPDMTFVTVEDGDETVRVWKEGGFLHVRVQEGEAEEVDVRLPEAVVDAFLSSEELDLEAAVEALREAGGGDLVTVHDRRKGEHVRVWIDDAPEAE